MKAMTMRLSIDRDNGLIHDSRQDVRKLAIAINEVINKMNEIVAEINKLENQRAD